MKKVADFLKHQSCYKYNKLHICSIRHSGYIIVYNIKAILLQVLRDHIIRPSNVCKRHVLNVFNRRENSYFSGTSYMRGDEEKAHRKENKTVSIWKKISWISLTPKTVCEIQSNKKRGVSRIEKFFSRFPHKIFDPPLVVTGKKKVRVIVFVR